MDAGKKGRLFRLVFALVLFVVAVQFFAGCGKKTSTTGVQTQSSGAVYPENGLPTDQKVKLSFLMPHQGYGKDYFMYAVETFQEKFPNVKIDVRWMEGRPAYRNLIQSLLQSGDDKEMYDYFYGFESWTEQLIEQGKIEPQDELWERALYDTPELKVKDAILADERLVFKESHIYSLPEGLSVLGLFYNKKMFKENGWNENPQDWEDFLELCAQIKSSGVYPMVVAGQNPGYFTYTWGAIPFEVGGLEYADDLYNWKEDIYISKPYLTMLERFETFVEKGYFHPGTISFNHTQAQMEFLQGKAAMVSTGCWVENEMETAMPEGFEWGFMPFPGNDKGQKKVILTSESQPGYIWKGRPELNKKWAKEFKLWCLNLDVQRRFMVTGIIPVRRDFEMELEGKITAVAAVQNAIKNKEVLVQTNRPDFRVRTIANAEMAKLNKILTEGFVKILSRKANAHQVAKEINAQYMKGLAAQ